MAIVGRGRPEMAGSVTVRPGRAMLGNVGDRALVELDRDCEDVDPLDREVPLEGPLVGAADGGRFGRFGRPGRPGRPTVNVTPGKPGSVIVGRFIAGSVMDGSVICGKLI